MQKNTFNKMVEHNLYYVENIKNTDIKKIYEKLQKI